MKFEIFIFLYLFFTFDALSQNQIGTTYKMENYFHSKEKMYGMLILHDEKVDTIYLLSTQKLNPLSFILDSDKKECRVIYESTFYNSWFGTTDLQTFYYSGNGVWKTVENKPFRLSTRITYNAMPSVESLERTIIRSDYFFEDYDTLKCIRYQNGKEIKEKILLNDNNKIIKLDEK